MPFAAVTECIAVLMGTPVVMFTAISEGRQNHPNGMNFSSFHVIMPHSRYTIHALSDRDINVKGIRD